MLPVVESWDALDPSSVDETAIRPGVDALCRQLGLDTRALSRFPAGSRPVYAAGGLVLKLYPQADGHASSVEASVLSAIDGTLPVAAPRMHATGDWHDWSYLLVLDGASLPVWVDVLLLGGIAEGAGRRLK